MRKININYTSDIHGYFYPTTYGDMEEKNIGLFKCYSNFTHDEDTLTIDGGDILQGSAFTFYCEQERSSCAEIAKIMSEAGYNYYTLGNHDFNYGTGYMREYISGHSGRCLCENVTDREGNILFPHIIKTMPNGLRVGLVGIVTDYVNVWEKKENIQDIIIADPFEAAKNALKDLKGKTDVNICIYHGGFESDLDTGKRLSDTTENVGYKICTELDYDLLLTGHQHMSVDGRYVSGTYVVQPMEYAKEFHKIEIEVYDKDDIKITSTKCAADAKADDRLSKMFDEFESKVQEWLNRPIGYINRDLLPEDKAVMALNGSGIAEFLNRVQIHASGAQLSAVGLANEIAGFHKKVSTRDVIATYPYPNTLVVLEITGRKLKNVCERSAEYFQIRDGKVTVADSFLIPKVEHYNYDYYYGMDYTIDPYRQVGDRITKMEIDGEPVKADKTYTICINNYRQTGAGGYPDYKDCKVIKEINVEMVELIMNYFHDVKNVEI